MYSFFDQNGGLRGHSLLDTLFLPKIRLPPHHTTELYFLIIVFFGNVFIILPLGNGSS